MKIISEKFDEKKGIYEPTIAFTLPTEVIEHTFTLTEDMVKSSGICPLVFAKEIENMINALNYRLLISSIINSRKNREELVAEIKEGIENILKGGKNETTQL